MATFTSFKQVASHWKRAHSPAKLKKDFVSVGSSVLKNHVKSMHGSKSLKPNSSLTVAMKGHNSPLLNTGKLRGAVVDKKMPQRGSFEVYSKNPFLQRLHEYGARWKMTDKQRRFLFAMFGEHNVKTQARKSGGGYIKIPARPIWRKALKHTKPDLKRMLELLAKKHLTN